MLNKRIRDIRNDAKKSAQGMSRVLKLMADSLASQDTGKILVASAFFQILKHHMENGDLKPENIRLATLLRGTEYLDLTDE